MAKATLLNFRCPDDLWAAIERIGGDRHPVPEAERHHRSTRDYDLTATVLDILRAGIVTLDGDESILDKTISKTLSKTNIEAMIHQAIANLPKPEPVDIEGRVNEAVSQAIASLNKQVFEVMVEIEDLKKSLAVGATPVEILRGKEDKPINYFLDVEGKATETSSTPGEIVLAIAPPDTENKPKSRAKRNPKPLCLEGLEALENAKKQGLEPMDKQTAGELGKSREYGSSVDGFCQMCRADNPDKAFREFGVVYDRETKKYFDVAIANGES